MLTCIQPAMISQQNFLIAFEILVLWKVRLRLLLSEYSSKEWLEIQGADIIFHWKWKQLKKK